MVAEDPPRKTLVGGTLFFIFFFEFLFSEGFPSVGLFTGLVASLSVAELSGT